MTGKLRWNDALAVTNLWEVTTAVNDSVTRCVTIIRQSNLVYVYFGKTVTNVNGTTDNANYTGTDELSIGGDGPSATLNGELPQLLIYNKALTETEWHANHDYLQAIYGF